MGHEVDNFVVMVVMVCMHACVGRGSEFVGVSSKRSQGSSLPSVMAGSEKRELLKNWGGGKNTHSVLEDSSPLPMCTSRPKRAR